MTGNKAPIIIGCVLLFVVVLGLVLLFIIKLNQADPFKECDKSYPKGSAAWKACYVKELKMEEAKTGPLSIQTQEFETKMRQDMQELKQEQQELKQENK